jgi:hypothetical protein
MEMAMHLSAHRAAVTGFGCAGGQGSPWIQEHIRHLCTLQVIDQK